MFSLLFITFHEVHPKIVSYTIDLWFAFCVYNMCNLAIDSRIVPSSFPNLVAELECVTLPWRPLP